MQPAQREPSLAAEPSAPRRPARWLFRAAALVLPLLVCLLLELGLRMAGFGYSTSFFLRETDSGTTRFVENPKFGWRFFPRSVARAPLPLVVASPKPPGTIRIFIFGESAAMGDPEPAYGFGRQLQRILQARHPAGTFEVVNVAMTAINSHVIRDIAQDCAPLQGDFWIIYAGNNEVVGPFGAGTVFGPRALGTTAVRALLQVKRLRLYQLLAGIGPEPQGHSAWQGMEFFLQNQVPASAPALQSVYRNFSANLIAILRAGQKARANILLCTVAANLKDCPPFGSAHRPGLSAAELKAWTEQFELGRAHEAKGNESEALECYQAALKIDSQFAELLFRRATCEMRLGKKDAAKADFSAARDLDTLRFRVDSRLDAMVMQAAENASVALLDAGAEFAARAGNGVPGDEFFYDHVHFNFSGNYLMATLLAKQVENQLFHSADSNAAVLPEPEVAHQLAFTEFDRHRVGEEMRLRFQQPPFSTQSNFRERDEQWARILAAPTAAAADAVWEYRAALALFPDDWMMRQNFASLLEAAGDKRTAADQWGQVMQELPGEPDAYFHLGNLAYDAGLYDQARQRFQECLARRPGSIESINGLGLVLAAQKKTNDAVVEFEKALKLDPRFSAARVNLAALLANRGQAPAAIKEYQMVLQLDTNNVAARINLARLWFSQGKTNEAVALYQRALELRTDSPVAHFDLANAFNAQGLHDEALKHYAAAVELQPDFAEAQYNLGLELARIGRIADALPHFAAAARLNPGSAETHFNYGVALAKLTRYQEAVEQFQQTLKLEPNHSAARSLLNRALQLSSNPPLQP